MTFNLLTFYDFRNRSKGEALQGKSKILFILKTMFDAISRILIFSIWMYVTNGGQFSSWTTFGAFYILVAVMFVFNVIFNDSKNIGSFEYWIGKEENIHDIHYSLIIRSSLQHLQLRDIL